MKTIYKYKLSLHPAQSIRTHVGAKILDVQCQFGDLVLWALVDESAPPEDIDLAVIYTGWPVTDGPVRYIATAQDASGSLVRHVFETARHVP
jgi:hypothetical protein